MPVEGLMERCYKPKEVAELLGVSADVVRDQFRRVPGVLVIGEGERKSLRIPESVFQTWLAKHRVAARS